MGDRTQVLNRLLGQLDTASKAVDGRLMVSFKGGLWWVDADEAAGRLATEFAAETGTPLPEAQALVDEAMTAKAASIGFAYGAAPGHVVIQEAEPGTKAVSADDRAAEAARNMAKERGIGIAEAQAVVDQKQAAVTSNTVPRPRV